MLWVTAVLCVVAARSAAGDALETIIDQLDPNADVIIAVPQLKRASDELTRCIEGMDRAGMLMGSRPIDQLKSLCTISAGLDELRGGAVLFYINDAMPTFDDAVFVVPVTDVGTFLEGNFEPGTEAGTHVHGTGKVAYVRSTMTPGAETVALSFSKVALNRYQPGGFAEFARQFAGDKLEGLRKGELFISVRGAAMSKTAALIARTADDRVAEQRNAEAVLHAEIVKAVQSLSGSWMTRFANETEGVVCTIDFDPLAAVARCVWRMKESLGVDEPAAAKPSEFVAFKTMPRMPYFAAVHVERPAIDAARRIYISENGNNEPDWVARVKSIDVMSYRTSVAVGADAAKKTVKKKEFAGGLLKNTILLAQIDEVGEAGGARAGFIDWVRGLDASGTWTTRVIDKECAIDERSAAALSAVAEFRGDGGPVFQTLHDLLLGPYGWQGLAMAVDGGVLVTCNQRSDWARRMAGSIAEPNDTFARDSVIQSLRAWLPGPLHVEAYFDVAALREAGEELMEILPSGGRKDGVGMMRKEAGSMTPPIGIAATVKGQSIDTTIVMPGPAMAVIVDDFMAWQRARMMEPRDGAAELPK